MAQESPNQLHEWWQAVRSRARDLRRQTGEWLDAAREEPVLIWQTPVVRYVVYGLAGMAFLLVLTWTVTPPQREGARPESRTADFHVVCSNARCAHHFVIHRKFGFRKFPVRCPQCEQKMGLRARPCNSESCRGRWVAPERIEGGSRCPECGGRFE